MKQKTALDELIKQIDNEEKVLMGLYGEEMFGRRVGLAFAKRVALELKEKEKEQIMDAYSRGADDEYNLDWNPLDRRDSIDCEQYYKETYE